MSGRHDAAVEEIGRGAMEGERIRRLLDRYPRLLEEADRHRHLAWYPSGGEAYKLALVPSYPMVDRFADHVFGGIGFERCDYMVEADGFAAAGYGRVRPRIEGPALERHRKAFRNALRDQARSVQALVPRRFADWLALIDDPGVFGGLRLSVTAGERRMSSTLHGLRIARRAIVVSELTWSRRRGASP